MNIYIQVYILYIYINLQCFYKSLFIHIIEFKIFIKNTSIKIENTNTNSFKKKEKKSKTIYTSLKKRIRCKTLSYRV